MIIWYLITLPLLAMLLAVIALLYRTGILRRKVEVTIVENLPIGIFKDTTVKVQEKIVDTSIQENSKSIEDNFNKELNPNLLDSIKEDNSCIKNKDIVYWTPNGRHYHKTQDCKTLLRSKVINSGSIDESGKLSTCHRCNQAKK